MAKELDAPYLPGARKGMLKIKRLRTPIASSPGATGQGAGTVGSLMLGLYDETGTLRVVATPTA